MKIEGYVKNMTHLWSHVMKRSVGPGANIPLQDIYDQYGKKHNLRSKKEFIKWLKEVKLRDRDRWQIFEEDGKSLDDVSTNAEIKDELKVESNKSRGDNVPPVVEKEIEISDIVGLSVRKAREIIPGIFDMQLLKYSEKEAKQLTGKDSLCIILRKRIQELSVSSRI
jgi:hypothetical protein